MHINFALFPDCLEGELGLAYQMSKHSFTYIWPRGYFRSEGWNKRKLTGFGRWPFGWGIMTYTIIQQFFPFPSSFGQRLSSINLTLPTLPARVVPMSDSLLKATY